MAEPFSLQRRGSSDDELAYLNQSFNTMRSRLRRHLNQREVLLREVHHRIKNNMLTVEGLLSLQEESMDNPEARAALKQARGRLQSMGVLYDRLYRSGAAREMPASEYLPPLINEILRVYPSTAQVHTETDIQAVVLHVNTLSSLGIIVNELLTNGLKHAFANGGLGTIRLELTEIEQHHAELVYRDDGVGISESAASGASGGLGMVLVKTLADQIDGTLCIRSDRGTSVHIRFPV
jgi:two-component sensor histidine kinase